MIDSQNLILIAQVLFLADLGILAVLDFKYRFAFTLLLAPMWAAAILAAIPLIDAAVLSYAIELAVITVVLMLAGIFHRARIGDGDIWILICALWVFAETPLVLVFFFLGTYLLAWVWAKRTKPKDVVTPDGSKISIRSAPVATCMAIVMVFVLPTLIYLHLMVF